MTAKVSVKIARDVDHTNAYTVTVTNPIHTRTMTVWTNDSGNGLWIDGKQLEGTSEFSAGRNPNAAIRKYFVKNWTRH